MHKQTGGICREGKEQSCDSAQKYMTWCRQKIKAERALTRVMIPHRILERQKKHTHTQSFFVSAFRQKPHAVLSLMVWHQHWDVNADSLFAMYASQTAHKTRCFLTFSGLSDEASTKDWEKCTIPTFLFSQNLWHQELGEVFRQSSYSPTGYNTTGQRGEKGGEKGQGKRKVRKVRKEWRQEWCPGFYLDTGKHSARHAKLMSWLCKNFDREKAETRAETGGSRVF